MERGPLVYAFEGIDNAGTVFDAVLAAGTPITALYRPDLLGGVAVLNIPQAAKATRQEAGGVTTQPASLVAIPYACWNNRGNSPMTVWLARDAARARVAPKATIASQAKITTSFHRNGMEPGRLNDQLLSNNATDGFAATFDFWPHKGTSEWIGYEFPQATAVHAVTVSWFDDAGSGGCRRPKSWRVLHLAADGSWQPVSGTSGFDIRKTEPVTVTFTPVTTTALRLEIQLPENSAAGLYEWAVESPGVLVPKGKMNNARNSLTPSILTTGRASSIPSFRSPNLHFSGCGHCRWLFAAGYLPLAICRWLSPLRSGSASLRFRFAPVPLRSGSASLRFRLPPFGLRGNHSGQWGRR